MDAFRPVAASRAPRAAVAPTGPASLVLVLLALGGCSSSIVIIEGGEYRRATLEEVRQAPATYAATVTERDGRGFIVKVAKREVLPLELDVNLSFLRLERAVQSVRFERDVYLLSSRELGLLIGPDGRRWAPIHDKEAIMELFGLENGTIQIGLGLSKDEGPQVHLNVDVR